MNEKPVKRPFKKPQIGDGTGRADLRRALGKKGEDAAAAYLADHGYAILHRNWRCRSGELDITAERSGTIIIVEVRTRTSGGRFGTAAESVDSRKQRQVRALAQLYIRSHRHETKSVRFDVIALTLNRHTGDIAELRHIEAAF